VVWACCSAVVALLSGCGPKAVEQLPICPGKASVAQALSRLRENSQKVSSLRANGTCLLKYYMDGKQHKEHFPIRLLVNPPSQIYLQGDVAFDAKGLVLGANGSEYWLFIKPKEISSYWWGRWSDTDRVEGLIVNPSIVLEALGMCSFDEADSEAEQWSLVNEGPYDILTKRDSQGVVSKRMHVCCCDYQVRRIEYCDSAGRTEVVAELDRYEIVAEGFSVPGVIKITKRGQAGEDSVLMTLTSMRPAQFNDRQVQYLFTRPEPRGFKHVYEIVGGRWVERE
jgi:hypothetical protein